MKDSFPRIAITLSFIMLFAGLFYTQIIRSAYYNELSKNNSIRVIPIDGPRGNILDRNGKVLVSSRMSFDVAVIYQQVRDRAKLVRLLKDVVGMNGSEIAKAFDRAIARPFVPVVVSEDIDKDKAILLEEEAAALEGLVVETKSKRNYVYKSSGAHVLGYLGEITEDETESLKDYGYRVGDLIGRSGVEKTYDMYLRGVDGGTQIEVDNRGRQTRVLGLKEPVSGHDLQLAIDIDIQQICDKALGESPGAVIVMDPYTGEILALASHPSFDPNVFVKPGTMDARLRLLKDRTGRPLSNRAVSGTYPPGSVFKIVTASAALETKKISKSSSFICTGSYRLGNAKFDCWKDGGHGPQEMVPGLMNSCNVYFYNVGRTIGCDQIEAFAKLFGFGRITGVDIPDEVSGIAPGKSWKRSRGKGPWYEGETLNYAIGQGYLTVTPIQVLGMMAVIANHGSLVKPYIAKCVDSKKIASPKIKKIGLKDSTVKTVRTGLYEVMNNKNGTGRRARIEGVPAAGKTGTAENPHGRTHAWFVGFIPYEDPKICVAVMLEQGGKGGLAAAEIAKAVFEEARKKEYF